MPTNPVTADFYIKQHDLLPPIVAVLKDATGLITDLTGATVLFKLRPATDPSAAGISSPVGIDPDPTTGKVTYSWSAGNTDTPGEYYGEFEVTFGTGKKESFPNDSYLQISIIADIS